MDNEGKGLLRCLGLSLSTGLLPVARTTNNRTSVMCRCRNYDSCPGRNLLLRTALTSKAGREHVRVRPISERLNECLLHARGGGDCYIFTADCLSVGIVGSFVYQGCVKCCSASSSGGCIRDLGVVPLYAGSLGLVLGCGLACSRLCSFFRQTCRMGRQRPRG